MVNKVSLRKNERKKYQQMVVIIIGVFLFFFAVSYLDAIRQMLERITAMITIPKSYIEILLKMTGIAYVCEFASNLCKDAGCQTIGSQVEMIGKLSMLLISIPIITSLTDTIGALF